MIVQDGELYWVRGVTGAAPFIVEYRANNRDRNGAVAGACFWDNLREVDPVSVIVLEHIPRPGKDRYCPRLGKIVGGCHFEARYDRVMPANTGVDYVKGAGASAFMESLKDKTYVCDVCTSCGKVIQRKPKEHYA